MSMYSNVEEPAYEPVRPTPPILWIGLAAFFALCCCIFFVIAGVEAFLLFGGGATQPGAATTGKPAFEEIKFYLAQTSTGRGSGTDVTNAPATAKAVYACFAYSNMPKTGATWGYDWSLDGDLLTAQSKADKGWTKEGNGTQCVPLTDDKGLKVGAYDLSLRLNGKEVQFNTVTIGQ